jgi:hypothetical protein
VARLHRAAQSGDIEAIAAALDGLSPETRAHR